MLVQETFMKYKMKAVSDTLEHYKFKVDSFAGQHIKKGQLAIIWPGHGEERKQAKLYNAKEGVMVYHRVEFVWPDNL